MIEQLDQLLSARKGLAQSIASLGLQARELPHAAPALQGAIASLKEQQGALEKQIADLTKNEESL